jgi:chromosome segregation ATPase
MSTLQKHSIESELDLLAKENEALQQQHIMLRNLLEKTQSENLRFKQRTEQLASALQERDKQLSDMQQFEYRFKRSKENAKELETNIEKDQLLIASLQDEKKQFESALSEQQQRIKQLEHVIQFLRSKAETAHLEAKQLQDDLQKNHLEIVALTQEGHNKEQSIDSLKQQLEQGKADRQVASDELQTIQQQWKHLQNAVQTAQNQTDKVRDEEKAIQKELERELHQLKYSAEEKDNEVKLAQQHLAKKLKELAILSDKHEEQQKLVIEQQKALNEAKFKMSDYQTNLDAHTVQEQRLKDQIVEITKAGEVQARKWEEKYVQMHNRLQEVEARNTELRNLEEKFIQMQQLLTNLRAIATPLVHENHSKVLEKHSIAHVITPKESRIAPFSIQQTPPPIVPAVEKAPVSEETSLFDSHKVPPRYKQNLFD